MTMKSSRRVCLKLYCPLSTLLQVMLGYLDNEAETAATIRGGWLHTGDIGHYDQEGNIYIEDRLKELIKVAS